MLDNSVLVDSNMNVRTLNDSNSANSQQSTAPQLQPGELILQNNLSIDNDIKLLPEKSVANLLDNQADMGSNAEKEEKAVESDSETLVSQNDTCLPLDQVLDTMTECAPFLSSSAENFKQNTVSSMSDSKTSVDFDVYTMETTLPTVDWATLEDRLHKAAKEENMESLLLEQFLNMVYKPEKTAIRGHYRTRYSVNEVHRRTWQNNREEIRRKLAMGTDSDENFINGERVTKKPNLQTRLQSGMNLQICFMNEPAPSDDLDAGDSNSKSDGNNSKLIYRCSGTMESLIKSSGRAKIQQEPGEADEDFLARQSRLQQEAKMALHQASLMARMQMEVERERRKKSPITEIVGLPFPLSGKRRLSRQMLTDMNVAQLQVIVNDLHTQIENLNGDLVKMLVERDDLHMEQDSMLVDIEDLTRRAKDQAERMKLKQSVEKLNIK